MKTRRSPKKQKQLWRELGGKTHAKLKLPPLPDGADKYTVHGGEVASSSLSTTPRDSPVGVISPENIENEIQVQDENGRVMYRIISKGETPPIVHIPTPLQLFASSEGQEVLRCLREVTDSLECHLQHEAELYNLDVEQVCPCKENEVTRAKVVLAKYHTTPRQKG